MIPFLVRLAINAVALAVAARVVPGIHLGTTSNGIVALIVVALIFGVVNAVIKPILALLTCPLYILTLGLFTFVVNALMLLLTSGIAQALKFDFQVEGFFPAVIGAIVIGVVSFVLSLIIPDSLEFGR